MDARGNCFIRQRLRFMNKKGGQITSLDSRFWNFEVLIFKVFGYESNSDKKPERNPVIWFFPKRFRIKQLFPFVINKSISCIELLKNHDIYDSFSYFDKFLCILKNFAPVNLSRNASSPIASFDIS